MSTLELGAVPEDLNVRMSQEAPFTTTIRAEGPDGVPVPWPPGTALRLSFRAPGEPERSFDFYVEGPFATLVIPEDEVTLLASAPGLWAQLWLTYVQQEEFLWATGQVTFYA